MFEIGNVFFYIFHLIRDWFLYQKYQTILMLQIQNMKIKKNQIKYTGC